MGSPEYTTQEAGGFLVTHAWFPPGASLEAHVHERATFAIMLTGGFDLRFTSPAIRRRQLACLSGTVFTEPAGEKHANLVDEDGATVVVVQPDPEHQEELVGPCAEVLDRIHHFRHGAITLAARRLAREVKAPDEVTPVSIESLALEMLAAAARLDEEQRSASPSPAWFERAEEFVHDHFRDSIRIADVAEAADVHPAHLASVFRSTYQMPLGTYIRSLRVEWAADRLTNSDDPISSIAFRAGFADQAHLTRVFKRQTGWTPARYRESRTA